MVSIDTILNKAVDLALEMSGTTYTIPNAKTTAIPIFFFIGSWSLQMTFCGRTRMHK